MQSAKWLKSTTLVVHSKRNKLSFDRNVYFVLFCEMMLLSSQRENKKSSDRRFGAKLCFGYNVDFVTHSERIDLVPKAEYARKTSHKYFD